MPSVSEILNTDELVTLFPRAGNSFPLSHCGVTPKNEYKKNLYKSNSMAKEMPAV